MATLNARVRWFSFLDIIMLVRIWIISIMIMRHRDLSAYYIRDVFHDPVGIVMLLLGKLKAIAATDVARIVNAVRCFSFM